MRKSILGTALMIAAAPVFSADANANSVTCAALTGFTLPGSDLKIEKTTNVAAGPMAQPRDAPPGPPVQLPAHCKVEGAMESRTGSDGKPYAIRFEINLPVEWNGRFLFQGGGGLNGSVRPALGNIVAGDKAALARGFAVVSNDTGHQASGFDASFMADQQAALNFLYQANEKVTVAAKQIVAAHYGRPAHHNYFVGCSTGGREAMMMSQRFPGYFDGIVAGAPAMRTSYSNLALRWATTQLNAVAPVDAQGRPETAKALSETDRKLVIDGLLEACDALDGAKDGLVFAAHRCEFDPAKLACTGAKTDSCLTTAQASAVKRALAGPRTAEGRQVYPGFPPDTGLTATRGLPGLLVGTVIPEGGPAATTMDVDAADAAAHDGRSMLGDTNAWTNLSGFRSRGGKLLFYHGNSDPWFSAFETVRYYDSLGRDNGPTPVADWSRLFLVPGMAHCAGGETTLDRFDMVGAIVNWVEHGQAPDSVLATGISMPGVSRPLCPYPQVPRFSGQGDMRSAANYSCGL